MAQSLGCELEIESAPHLLAFAALPDAGERHLGYCGGERWLKEAAVALARGAWLLTTPALAAHLPQRGVLTHRHPEWLMAELMRAFAAPLPPPDVDPSAVLEANVQLWPGVRIGKRAHLGNGTVIGRPGFGLVTAPDGTPSPMPHLGGVVIEDDVRTGAYCTLDAGVLAPTRLGRHTCLDSHVHVGHNCELGERVRVAAQVGLAGSVQIADDVWIGGQAGVADHVRIGRFARIAAKAGVIGDVPERAVFAGYPAVPRMRWLRGQARLYRERR